MPKARFAAFPLLLAATLAIALTPHEPKPAAAAEQAKTGLPTILAQLDAASAKFTSAQADMRLELFTKVVQDTEKQLGQIYFQRKNGATQGGMKLFSPDAPANSQPVQIFEFKGETLRMFNPRTNQLNEYSATGKNQGTAQAVLAVGFGGSGADLVKSWTIADQGPETLKDGAQSVQTEKLDLVAKDETIRKTYSHITIWVDPVRDVTLKQISYAPSGDTRTAYYSNIQLNKPIEKPDSFAIKCKGKCS